MQEKKLRRIKKNRSASGVKDALNAIRRCCDDNGNLMEVIVESVKASVTEGEISDILKKSYGTGSRFCSDKSKNVRAKKPKAA